MDQYIMSATHRKLSVSALQLPIFRMSIMYPNIGVNYCQFWNKSRFYIAHYSLLMSLYERTCKLCSECSHRRCPQRLRYIQYAQNWTRGGGQFMSILWGRPSQTIPMTTHCILYTASSVWSMARNREQTDMNALEITTTKPSSDIQWLCLIIPLIFL